MLLRYGVAVAATLAATVLRRLLDPVLEDAAPFSVYFVAIMFTAWYAGLGPSLLALVSGAVLATYLFVQPRGLLLIRDVEHQVSLAVFVAVGVVVALLSESLHASRRRTEAARGELAPPTAACKRKLPSASGPSGSCSRRGTSWSCACGSGPSNWPVPTPS